MPFVLFYIITFFKLVTFNITLSFLIPIQNIRLINYSTQMLQ